MTNYPVGRYWRLRPLALALNPPTLQSGILLATPLHADRELRADSTRIGAEPVPANSVAALKPRSTARSTACHPAHPLVAADIPVRPASRAIWQVPVDSPVVLTAGNYFAVSMLIGNMTLLAIDADSQEIESILGRASLADIAPRDRSGSTIRYRRQHETPHHCQRNCPDLHGRRNLV